jgi:hypothetical protein
MGWKTGDFVVDLDAEMPCFPMVSNELTFLLIRGLMVRVHQGALKKTLAAMLLAARAQRDGSLV